MDAIDYALDEFERTEPGHSEDVEEARNTIAALREDNARLREALEKIARDCDTGEHTEIARATLLARKPDESIPVIFDSDRAEVEARVKGGTLNARP